MRFLVTGATGFLGSRFATVLSERGHDVVGLVRPGRGPRALAPDVPLHEVDAGDPAARRFVDGRDAVLHFAGVPSPERSRRDPAAAVRANAGTTVNLLEGCLESGAGLVYPSTIRAAADPPPDPYALSKRLGEEACRLHAARATVIRLTSVFGPGQVAWEGATGAIASFAACALGRRPIVIPGNPERARDFVYVDDLVPAVEAIVAEARWGETLVLASGVETPLSRAAELVRDAAGVDAPIETPGGDLAPGENATYAVPPGELRLRLDVRPLADGVERYVEWLRSHPAAQGRAGG